MALPKLPDVACISDEQFTNTFKKKHEYLAQKFEKTSKDTMDINVLLMSNKDMDTFTKWWTIILDYGNNIFEIDTMLMGSKKKIAVKFDNDFTAKVVTTDENDATWSVAMRLNIEYIIEDI